MSLSSTFYQTSACIKLSLAFLQVYFDIGTPSDIFNIVRAAIDQHMAANQKELSGDYACCNFGCADPMKIKFSVYFEYVLQFNCNEHSHKFATPPECC